MGDTDQINRLGVALVDLTATKLGLIFREQPTSDFGIDAQLEIKIDGQATGRLIAVQIKAGQSRFQRKPKSGFWHSISSRHQELWLNHSLPVIVILCDLETSICFWEIVTTETCITAGENWKINIPRARLRTY